MQISGHGKNARERRSHLKKGGEIDMERLFLRWLILSVAVVSASYLIEGIHVSGFFSAFFTAAILGILNVFLRPVLLLLTLPINVLTFGLFTFVINAFMLKMASGVISGFEVRGFWSAIIGSLIISVVSWILNALIKEKKRMDYIDLEKKGGNRWE